MEFAELYLVVDWYLGGIGIMCGCFERWAGLCVVSFVSMAFLWVLILLVDILCDFQFQAFQRAGGQWEGTHLGARLPVSTLRHMGTRFMRQSCMQERGLRIWQKILSPLSRYMALLMRCLVITLFTSRILLALHRRELGLSWTWRQRNSSQLRVQITTKLEIMDIRSQMRLQSLVWSSRFQNLPKLLLHFWTMLLLHYNHLQMKTCVAYQGILSRCWIELNKSSVELFNSTLLLIETLHGRFV